MSLMTVTQNLQTVKDTLTGAPSQLANGVAEGVQNTVVASVQDWLAEHPLVAWIVHHPIASLILAGVLVVVFWGLIRAIAQLTEHLWLSILQVPLKLSLWFWAGFRRLLPGTKRNPERPSVGAEGASTQTQLIEILTRMEVLYQEQSQLMKDFKTLVANQNIKINDVNDLPSQSIR
jgi:hypothetical protein